jgi:hypothetical protein
VINAVIASIIRSRFIVPPIFVHAGAEKALGPASVTTIESSSIPRSDLPQVRSLVSALLSEFPVTNNVVT